MMTFMILDDEPRACANLARKLTLARPAAKIITCTDPVQALSLVKEQQPAALFLDINMPGLTGFDWLAQIPPKERNFALVFCTAYDSYALRAFEERATDYLLKPVDPDRLEEALARLPSQDRGYRSRSIEPHLPRSLRRLATSCGSRTHLVEWERIIHATSHYHETVLRLSCGSEHICAQSLGHLERLMDPVHFVRCHRAHIIQLVHVDYLEDSCVWLKGGLGPVPVSRRRRRSVRSALEKLGDHQHPRMGTPQSQGAASGDCEAGDGVSKILTIGR